MSTCLASNLRDGCNFDTLGLTSMLGVKHLIAYFLKPYLSKFDRSELVSSATVLVCSRKPILQIIDFTYEIDPFSMPSTRSSCTSASSLACWSTFLCDRGHYMPGL